jgi:RecB family endonuclease NucS
VVELKKFKAGPSIIDQIQRYMGWIMDYRSKPGLKVRGLLLSVRKAP